MKSLINPGIHIFDQFKKLDWEEDTIFFNLASILCWKKNHGVIHLYCNSEYLNTLKKYNVQHLYDYINTDLLDNKPPNIDYNQYWAYSKLWVIQQIHQNYNDFTVLDTDLIVTKPLSIDKNQDVMFYHLEKFDVNYEYNSYPDFDCLLPPYVYDLNLDKSILPTNCALLYINNKTFIDEWVRLSEDIAIYSKDVKLYNTSKSSKMCFIEQRLLPMLLNKRGLKYSTFISQIYLSHLSGKMDGSEWWPSLESLSKTELDNFINIKHVWGLKKLFHHDQIRHMVLHTIFQLTKDFEFVNKPYFPLCKKLYENLVVLNNKLSTK